jgi:hypothetical protein
MTTLLENELPLSLVMQAVDGPLVVTRNTAEGSSEGAPVRPKAASR